MADDPRFPRPPLHGCSGCREDFNSISAFDAHRVGKYEHVFGIEHLNGRRCLDTEELALRGFVQNARGRWAKAQSADNVRRLRAFHGEGETATSGRVSA